MTNTKDEIKKEVTPQEFATAYQELCTKMGYRIVVSPSWASTNHGSFELVLQYTVGQLPQEPPVVKGA